MPRVKKPTEKASTKEFAVIETGGKQYRVAEGDTVTIEKLADDQAVGKSVTFDKVLMVDDGVNTTLGDPYIKGATVRGSVTDAGKAKKVTVIKYKQKVRYFKKRGHRQPYVKVKITKIT